MVFSDAWWIGKKDDNPSEAKLPLPQTLVDAGVKAGTSAFYHHEKSLLLVSEGVHPEAEVAKVTQRWCACLQLKQQMMRAPRRRRMASSFAKRSGSSAMLVLMSLHAVSGASQPEQLLPGAGKTAQAAAA